MSLKKFKTFLKVIIILSVIFLSVFLMRFNPAFLGSIPAFLFFLFRWRGVIFFLKNIFLSKHSKFNFAKRQNMTKQEALEILNLKEGATEAEILKSYYALLKKNHPDLGGSNWFTSKLNKAKETLLG